MKFSRTCLITLLWALPSVLAAQVKAPIVVATNTTIRVMASNLSSGNNQRYETAGLDILKGLKPDVVAMQEFNYVSTNGLGTNSTSALREMIDRAFGTNFVYFRQSGSGITIPNGVISRFPIIASGVWDDVQVSDREFVWAQLDIPGTNDLYVVSVHLHSGGGPSSRSIEASNLKNLIQSNFPTNSFVIVAGDFNTDSRAETNTMPIFKTFLSDDHIPTDAVSGGDPDTNQSRQKPYDYVLPSFVLSSNQVPTIIASHSFANGLVFDSRVYTPLTDVVPVQFGDSTATNMQHMGVVKDFRISYTVTNFVDVIAPRLTLVATNILRWSGQTNVTYTVQASTNLPGWFNLGTASSSSTNFTFTNSTLDGGEAFYRVVYP
jgi:endonuclease/exonuclease/phosphatase family metal-dependent hydrolase